MILTADQTAPFIRLDLELLTAPLRDRDTYAESVRQITTAWLALADQFLAATGARLPHTAGLDALAMLDGPILVRASIGTHGDGRSHLGPTREGLDHRSPSPTGRARYQPIRPPGSPTRAETAGSGGAPAGCSVAEQTMGVAQWLLRRPGGGVRIRGAQIELGPRP